MGMFVAKSGMGFVSETYRLVKEKKISPILFDLLSKMLVKNPIQRFCIQEVLAHEWFKIMDDDNDEDMALEVVEECEHNNYYLSMCSAFGSLQVTEAYNDSLVDSDYNDLLNGSTSFNDYVESMDASNARESMLDNEALYDYDDEYDEEEEVVKVSIRISELF